MGTVDHARLSSGDAMSHGADPAELLDIEMGRFSTCSGVMWISWSSALSAYLHDALIPNSVPPRQRLGHTFIPILLRFITSSLKSVYGSEANVSRSSLFIRHRCASWPRIRPESTPKRFLYGPPGLECTVVFSASHGDGGPSEDRSAPLKVTAFSHARRRLTGT